MIQDVEQAASRCSCLILTRVVLLTAQVSLLVAKFLGDACVFHDRPLEESIAPPPPPPLVSLARAAPWGSRVEGGQAA